MQNDDKKARDDASDTSNIIIKRGQFAPQFHLGCMQKVYLLAPIVGYVIVLYLSYCIYRLVWTVRTRVLSFL